MDLDLHVSRFDWAGGPAGIGVSALVTGAVGDDPGGWLESTFGPAMDRIKAIEPARL